MSCSSSLFYFSFLVLLSPLLPTALIICPICYTFIIFTQKFNTPKQRERKEKILLVVPRDTQMFNEYGALQKDKY